MSNYYPFQYDIDEQRRADMLRDADQQRLLLNADLVPQRRLRRAISRALFSAGGALVRGGTALQARANGLSAHLRRDDDHGAPRQRRIGGY